MKYNQIVSRNIKRILKGKGLKQCSVAEKSGYSSQQFSAMMNGRKIVKDIDVLKIANALEVSANELFKREGE